MMKNILLLLCVLGITSLAKAQWSVGGRFGGFTGVTFKSYPASSSLHFEGIASASLDETVEGFAVTLLLEKFGSLSNNDRLNAFLGFGETMIFGDEFYLGVNAILGFDWRIGKRIGLQLDWMPAYIFVNESYFSPINGAVTARWIFGGRYVAN